jgi:hypothetical protein
MNLDAIKKKLEALQSAPVKGGGSKYPQKFKPSIGKQSIRVVPFKFNKENPFIEMKMYYGIGSKKIIASPLNWGEKDPIAEFAKSLRGSNDKENWRLAKKLDPKVRYQCPVIVRGDEEAGVVMWEFGKEIYEAFLSLAADEEVGDFTDIMVGRDIKLSTVGPDVTGTAYNKTTIQVSIKTSPLSDDETEIEKWLEEQINPLDTFKPLPFDEIKAALAEFITPDEDGSEAAVVESSKSFETEIVSTPKSNYSVSTKPVVKQTKEDKFDALFEDDDDMPF